MIVSELSHLADIGTAASPPVRFAYEALGWGTHVADWEESLRIVELVGRHNFGLCLDTYHILARLWADPTSPDSGTRAGGRAALSASMKRLLSIPNERIFYIQPSDAERCQPPLLPGHPAFSLHKYPSHSWYSWGRLFPGEVSEGAYLPMAEACHTMLLDSDWNGWVSLEIFHRRMKEETADPEHWAARVRASWDQLCSRLKQ
jgi:4-hydroxyphenylpyruvate dioxygenase